MAAMRALLQQQQQALEAREKREAEEAARREQGRGDRPDTRPLPAFTGAPFDGKASEVEAWVRAARIELDILPPHQKATQRAVAFLARGLKGLALEWYSLNVISLDEAARPANPEAFFALLLQHFPHKLAAETARDDLFALKQGKQTVTEYAARFRSLLALLPASSFDEATRLQMFRNGLVAPVQDLVVQQQQQPATMDAMIELAARIESRMAPHRQTQQIAVAETEMQSLRDSLSEMRLQVAALSSSSPPPPSNRQKGQNNGQRREGQPTRGQRREYPSDDPLSRLQTSEQRKKLMEKNLCFYCASPDHRRPDCPVARNGAPPTPAALGN
jgi:hypothetical protein